MSIQIWQLQLGVCREYLSFVFSSSTVLTLCHMWLQRSVHPSSAPPLILPSPLPIPGPSTKPKMLPPRTPTPVPTPVQRKRAAPPLDEDEMRPTKRSKPSGTGVGMLTSPNKKRKLDDDGLVLLDDPAEKIDIDEPELVTIVADD